MRKLLCLSTLPFLFLALLINSCQKPLESWSMFRGPNASGVQETEGLPSEFGPETNVIWKINMPAGYSSPVLSDKFIFLTGMEDEDLFTYCINRETGSLVWKTQAPRPREEKLDRHNHPAAPSVATDGKSVFVFFSDFGLLAYDMEGHELWQVPLGPFSNAYGMGNSPMIAGNRVVLVCDQNQGSFIIAVNKNTGKVAWKKERPGSFSSYPTPVIYKPGNGKLQVLVPGTFKLTSYAVSNGELLWWTGGIPAVIISSPVIWNDLVLVTGYTSPVNNPENIVVLPGFDKALKDFDEDGNGKLIRDELPDDPVYELFGDVDLNFNGELDQDEWAFFQTAMASPNGVTAFKPGGQGNMTGQNKVWSFHQRIPEINTPLVYEGILYMINNGGYMTTLKADNGELIEQGRLPKAGVHFFASPVASDGKVFFINRNGRITVVEAGGKIDPLAQGDLEEMCIATPAISNGRIYIRTANTLYCFGME